MAGAPARRAGSRLDGTRAPLRRCSLRPPLQGLPARRQGARGWDSRAPRKPRVARPVWGERVTPPRGRAGVAAAGGTGSRPRVALPPGHLFSACREASPRFRVRAAARMGWLVVRGGEARGASLRAAGRARQLRVWRRVRGRARRGSRPGGARLAASGEESPGRRRLCLRPDGGPLGGAENFSRVRSLPPRWPRWQPVCRPEMNCSFSI